MAILKDLIVHGSSRFLNKIYASEIQTPLIEAEAGIIKKLKADDVTVVGLLDVKGQLHTNSWSNSNIATIDGSFYITPTIGSASGTVSITSSSLTFSGTNYAVSSLYLGDGSSIAWPRYSKVLVTGQILSNGEWIPLGTLLGQLNNAATATSININNIKDNKNQTSNVLATLVSNGTTSSDYRNLKVSLYQRASSSTAFYPLGIYMTATGTNGRTFLDIYGGVEALSNSNNYGGFAEPNVRIGNLQGLPNVGGQTPSGWGIYTDNGYFKGIIAADQGYIGSGSRYWVIANYEDGSNPNNSRSYIYSYNGTDNGTDSVTSTVEGIYLGTDGIRNYKDSTHYVTIKDGVITAKGVDLTGEITASSGSIGGWNIGTDTNKSLYYGNQTPGATTTNLILSPTSATNSNAIGGSGTGLKWFLSAGKVFGVTTAGALYATSGKIGGFDIGTTYIKNTKTSYSETTNNGVWVGTDGIGLGKGLFYVTNAGALTAKSGSIAGWSFNTSSLYKTNATPGYNTSTMVISTGTTSTKAIGGSDTTSKSWMISAGTGFGVTTAGVLYANNVHISGEITATSGTIGGIQLDSSGKLWIKDANISGTIRSNHIDVSSISIGMSQVTNLSTALEGKQAAGDYATNTALSNVSTTANTALGQSVWYAECPTAAGTAVKVATISPVTTDFTLTKGVTVNVKFTNTNSATNSSLQLNVNGTGAKHIKYIYNGSYTNIVVGYLKANQMYQFRYDGTYWIVQMMYNSNNYDRSLYSLPLAASEVIAAGKIAVLGLNNKLIILKSTSFYIDCPPLYVGTTYEQTHVTNTNTKTNNYTYWGTAFNLTSTHSIQSATANTNVYIVGTLSGNIFTPNTTVLTCAEPTTQNGLYYMLLGRMTSTTNAVLQAEHPIYIYKNGNFQKLEATTATSYITYIDANNGIKIHNESDTLNYLQLNSTAISVYRNNIETLNISNNEIRIGKFSDNNVFIDSDSVDIRKGTTTFASFTGDNTKFYDPIYNKELATFGASGAIIGANNEQRFVIEKDGIKSINDSGATVFSVNSTEGTVVTEAEIAPSGEANAWYSTSIKLDPVGSGFSVDVTFYNKSMTARFDISYCNSNLTNVKVNSVSSSATLISFSLNSGSYSIDLPPFTFTHGTAQTITYTITASFVNIFGDSYNLTVVETVTYDGAITIIISSLDGECVRTSGNNEEESKFMGSWSKVVYGKIYQNSAYTKAPAMAFGTRGKNAILAPFSVTIGKDLYANNDNQLSIGRYNLNNDEFAFAIGNGTSDTNRSNAFNVDWDGNTEVMGNLEVNNNQTVTNNLSVGGDETIIGGLIVNGIITDFSNSYSTIKNLNVEALTVSTRKPFLTVRKTYTRTITANSACYISQSYTSPTGYIPVGIIDWGAYNGTHADYCIMGHAYIWRGNPNSIDIYVWNQHPSESATNVVIYVDILCIANTFL